MMDIYNCNFDGTSNRVIEELVSRTNDKRKARLNRKNGASALDLYFQYIHIRWLSGKSLPQIMTALKNEHNLCISKSALSRFINKKFKE